MADSWILSGEYFESCNCEVACPCVFASDPTHGHCTVLIGWHIDKGRSGNGSLDGLNFALAVYSPGNMLKTKWEVSAYVDEGASLSQRKALEFILGGQAGGTFGALAPLIGKSHGVRFAPIEFKVDGKKRWMRIKGIAEMNSESIAGAEGAPVKIAGAPLLLVPEVTVAKAAKMSLADHGWKWENLGGSSFHAPFHFKGP